MRFLFDSHALVWFLLGDTRLPARLRATIEQPDLEVFISAVCAWEIASKVRRGKWPEAADIPAMIDVLTDANTFQPLPITIRHARIAGYLPGRHRDPFDRMLAAQSQAESMHLMTADPVFQEFGVQVLW